MDDLTALAALPALGAAAAPFLSWALLDAVAPAGAPPAGAPAADAPLARVVRALLLDALARGAVEPTFSERLARAGVPAAATALLSAALFDGASRGAALGAARARLARDGGCGADALDTFDWTAKAVLASSAVGAGARDAVLALTLVARGADGARETTAVELSRAELAAVIARLEAAADAAAAVRERASA
jgi:hypothetical protein